MQTLDPLILRIALVVLIALATGTSRAQCSNSATPSCSVYDSCFAKFCSCSGPNEYFVTYGKKYCERFLNDSHFSAAGKAWRDKTLVCLQEKIIPRLDISVNPSCDCGAMRTFAFQSHVSCYKQAGNSICDLPIGDVNEIRKVVDVSDAFSSEGWRQMRQVADKRSRKAT